MGAGRKTETYTLAPNPDPRAHAFFFRNLMKKDLGAVIFGCTNSTMRECLSKQLFGLPAPHHEYVKNITPDLPLFLFNYSDRKLHGIFEATCHGQMNIDPYGWTADGSGVSPFPAQVRVRVRLQCKPLLESQFKPIIADNYFNPLNAHHFWFELDHHQTRILLSLLAPGKPTPQKTMLIETDFQALPSCSTIQKAEPLMPSTSKAENPTPVPNLETEFPALPTRNTIQKAGPRIPSTSKAENPTPVLNLETDFPALPTWNRIQKAESLKPPTSGNENLTSLTTVNCGTEFPDGPSHKWKAVACKPPTSVTSATCVPQKQCRVEPETDLPSLPSSSCVEDPKWPYQHTSDAEWPYQHTPEVEHLISSSLKGDPTSSTPQNTVKWEPDFPDFPSERKIQEPEWLEALISEAEHLNSSRLRLESVPLSGTYGSFQSDVKKAEQEELQLMCTKLNELKLQRNLHSECPNIHLAGDVVDSRAESPNSQSDRKSGESSCYFSAESPGSMFYRCIVAKLLQEVQELKALSTAQTERMWFLEDKLVQSQIEIQQLKKTFL